MSAYRYIITGRPVIVAGRAGKWWYKIGAVPKVGDQLTGHRYSTRADAVAAATEEINPTTGDTL